MEWQDSGIYVATFTGTGTDATAIKGDQSTGSKWVTIGGRVSAGGAGAFCIFSSDTAEVDRIEFVARSTAKIPGGVMTSDGKGLYIQNSDIAHVNGWVAYKSVKYGENVPQLFVLK